eukprot:evm.model.scf_402.5 EVM.evm.TU.scf_402.5   scf_402:46865-47503(-)
MDSEATQSVSAATQSASQETISAGADGAEEDDEVGQPERDDQEEAASEGGLDAAADRDPRRADAAAALSGNGAGGEPDERPVVWSWAYKWVTVERPFGVASLRLRKWVREAKAGGQVLQRRGVRKFDGGKNGAPIIVGGFMEYHCPGCKKVFTSSGSLRKHMHIHGEKHFVCDHPGCGKRFIDKSKLKRHVLTHVDRKPGSERVVPMQEEKG